MDPNYKPTYEVPWGQALCVPSRQRVAGWSRRGSGQLGVSSLELLVLLRDPINPKTLNP